MASTFRRRRHQSNNNNNNNHALSLLPDTAPPTRPLTALLPGTKSWTAGTTLVSTGLRELDVILSSSASGQPLGSCIVLQQDRFTSIAETILRYWCAEALVQDQALLIPVRHNEQETDSNEILPEEYDVRAHILNRLPRSLHLSQGVQQEVAHDDGVFSATAGLDTLVEEQEGELEVDADKGLIVAWQYRSDIQHERLGLATEQAAKRPDTRRETTICHSYDLSASLNTQINVVEKIVMCPILVGPPSDGAAFQCARTIINTIAKVYESQPNRVIRLVLIDVQLDVVAKSLPLILGHIRRENLPVVLFIKVGAFSCKSTKWNRIVQRLADVVLEAESFASRRFYPPPPEFRQFIGILKVHKSSTATMAATMGHFADLTTQRRPAANVYGVKRDSRKLHLSLLHIPPEDFASEGGSVGSGAERSGAGKVARSIGSSSTSGGGGLVVPDF